MGGREVEYSLTDDPVGFVRIDFGTAGGGGGRGGGSGFTGLGSLITGMVGGDGVIGWYNLGLIAERNAAVRGSCLVTDTMDTSGITMGVKSEDSSPVSAVSSGTGDAGDSITGDLTRGTTMGAVLLSAPRLILEGLSL